MGGGREARKAEAAAKKKLIADAGVALEKIEAARTIDTLAAAIKAAEPFSSAASLQKALPAARQRLAALQAEADKARKNDFLSRVEEAEKRDMKHPKAKSKAEQQLRRYFEQVFDDADRNKNKTWDFEEFSVAMDIIAPSIRGDDLKAAFDLADEDGSGSIDAEEFMSRASQYQSLSEKIGDGHTCRKGSLASMSVPSAPAVKPEKPPAAAPLEGASRSSRRPSRPAAVPLEEAPCSRRPSRPAAVPLEEAPRSRGSSHATVTPVSTPPLGRDSSPAQRSAAATSTVRRDSIVAGFTDADKEQAARLFAEYDDDGSGELDFDEFREVMREIAGKTLSDEQLHEAFSAVDTDGNGMVSWDEFLEGQMELRKWRQKKKPSRRRRTEA